MEINMSKQKPTPPVPDEQTTKNRPIRLPMSFDDAVEGLLNVKRPPAVATKKAAKKTKKPGK